MNPNPSPSAPEQPNDPLSNLVAVFLSSKLSIILILLSLILGLAALWVTPREEDPQIVVPLADIHVAFPGHSADDVERMVSTPLERMLYQIDGVEYVYSMSRDDAAIITVRFYVGQDRERSLVKLFKKLNENADAIPPGITGWTIKPIEIDDVPIVTLALTGNDRFADSYALRRVAEELVERLSTVPNVSRAVVSGGEPRAVRVEFDPQRLRAYGIALFEAVKAIESTNPSTSTSNIDRQNVRQAISVSPHLIDPSQLPEVVVGTSDQRPIFLKDVATIHDGPDEVRSYTRHGWGPAAGQQHHDAPGTRLGASQPNHHTSSQFVASDQGVSPTGPEISQPSVTIALSKQKGANAVQVAASVIREADRLQASLVPSNVDVVITRNSGITANEKVNELIEGLGVAIVIVILLLTFGLGWREAIIVSVAVPVVFGLTLGVNYLFGYTINRVTLFALILALGLLVDDPIVDVENIARHFEQRKRATRKIVLEAVAEIRPPLISATLAVIVSFLPMFFITGMMGPYMSPMALNVPVAMLMSMLVAFTITPWLTYQVLKWRYPNDESQTTASTTAAEPAADSHAIQSSHHAYDPEEVRQTFLYRLFRPLVLPLIQSRSRALLFLLIMGLITFAAMGLGALRMVPLKMLPFDNKNELLVLLDLPENATLEKTDSVIQQMERVLQRQPEVINFVSSVGTPGPIDFNGMVRHYYLRTLPHQAEIRVNFVGKKNRHMQSHAIALRIRDELDAIAQNASATLRLVELPPGPPVLASLVAEVYGRDFDDYPSVLDAANAVAQRLRKEPGVVEVDDMRESLVERFVFVPDQEKAAVAGITVDQIADAIQLATGSDRSQIIRLEGERNPLKIVLQLPRSVRSDLTQLAELPVKGKTGNMITLAELGHWQQSKVSQTIYHKNLRRVAYVFAECVGRTPAECIVDVLADYQAEFPDELQPVNGNRVADVQASSLSGRTFLNNGSQIPWRLAEGMQVDFAGEGEWKITLDVFRDLGLAFGAAMLMIYILLVAQTGSFLVPLVVMLAIPLTALGVMPGFYLLNLVASQSIQGYEDPVFFTATAMIGMIALSGIVTRDSIILVDFMRQAVEAGRPLVDAILESRVVRLRPILLTAGAAMLSALPITLDPIFSGLGWSLIFGLLASTLFTLFVIPVTYWILYAGQPTRE